MQATDSCKIDFPGSQGRSVSWSYFVFVSGQGSSGSKVYSGMNITIGDLVVVCEWILSSLHAGPQMRRTLSITENQQQDPQARLMKQVWLLIQLLQVFIMWLIKSLKHTTDVGTGYTTEFFLFCWLFCCLYCLFVFFCFCFVLFHFLPKGISFQNNCHTTQYYRFPAKLKINLIFVYFVFTLRYLV